MAVGPGSRFFLWLPASPDLEPGGVARAKAPAVPSVSQEIAMNTGRMMSPFTRTRCAAAAAVAVAGPALARPEYIHEPFDLPVGPLPGAVGGRCMGLFWPNAWVGGPFVKAGVSLNHPLAFPSSGARCVGSGAMEAWRDFCGPLSPFGTDLWISVLMRSLSGAPTEAFLQFRDFTGAGEVSLVRGAGMPIELRLLGAGPVPVGVASAPGTTDLVVIRLHSPAPGVVEAVAYLNPSGPSSPSSPPISVPAPAYHLTQMYMRITGDQQIDEVRIGDKFPCYADCNDDGLLNVADFGCFQTRFALSEPYADCNKDGAFTVADFGCFQTKFTAGCP